MPVERAEEIVDFWRDVGPGGWYAGGAALDAEITRRFRADWDDAAAGRRREWFSNPVGALAYMILTDQFPRQIFRDDPRAFATDHLARSAARVCIDRKLDLHLDEPIRQFFYLPFMHAENLFDQDRCVCLMLVRLPETGQDNIRHARAHRDVIRRFGRFPWRNAVLGRKSSDAEAAFVAEGGYAGMIRDMV